MKIQTKIHNLENRLAIPITDEIQAILQLKEGDTVEVSIIENKLAVSKVKGKRFTEDELIKGLTAYTAHADELPTLLKSETDF